MDIKQFTEDSLTVQFEYKIDPKINKKIVQLKKYIDQNSFDEIVETVVSYTQLVIYFDVRKTKASELVEKIQKIDEDKLEEGNLNYRVVEFPVSYDREFGEDIPLFENDGINQEELINLHANKEYLVYMLGFMPGFVYLGGLDSNLHKDRLETPRTEIPAGSVGIAGKQTGMYPFSSPGGWNLIGRTPVKLYDPRRGNEAIYYEPGDRIIFRPVSKDEYFKIKKQIKAGTYQLKITKKEGF